MADTAKVLKMNRRGRRRMTIQERIAKFLGKSNGYVDLTTIYKNLRANSVGDRAGIRGVLNRGCGKGGIFIRNKKTQGEYGVAA